jgi:hypothetical protein
MTEARLKGILPPDAFADETRPDIVESPQLTPEQFAVNEVRSLMNAHYCYEPPIWYGQPYHVIVICEKLAQFPMLKRLLKDWQVEILILKGGYSLHGDIRRH